MSLNLGKDNGLGGRAGGYYTGMSSSNYNLTDYLGGLGAVAINGSSDKTENHNGGNGGTAGSGGTISVASTATIYAYNGNIYSDGTSYKNGANQAYIYAQNGIINARVILPVGSTGVLYGDITYIDATTVDTLDDWNTGLGDVTYTLSDTVELTFDMSKQGIGSGAGYIEVSNGTYTVDSSMN